MQATPHRPMTSALPGSGTGAAANEANTKFDRFWNGPFVFGLLSLNVTDKGEPLPKPDAVANVPEPIS